LLRVGLTRQPVLFNINGVTGCRNAILLLYVMSLLPGGSMPICPECESPLDFEADEVEEGDVIICDECGSEFEVIATDPLEIVKVDEDYEDSDDDLSGEDEEEA
jgi:alpha-aminoadipate/glutamate carrier protein LysW